MTIKKQYAQFDNDNDVDSFDNDDNHSASDDDMNHWQKRLVISYRTRGS